MPLLDVISNGFSKIAPNKASKSGTSMSGGIGSGGHGMVPFEDDSWMAESAGQLVFLLFVPALWIPWIWMIVSKPTIIFHTSQIFFNFLAMACFASVAAFQAKFNVGPSGLSGFAIFISVAGIFLSLFMLLIPVLYEKYDKFVRLARALKEVRVGFILTGVGTTASLLISFIVTISAWTQPGCKNADNDPNADLGDDFKNGLPGWCNTKKAAAIFFWLTFAFWTASLVLLVLDWRSGKLHAPRDTPFAHPQTINDEEELEDDEESSYHHVPPARQASSNYDNSNVAQSPFADSNRYSVPTASAYTPTSSYATPASINTSIPASRPSMDAYGAFSDPAPSGFGAASPLGRSPVSAPPDVDSAPKVSRTMQYADPYAAVRATISGQQAGSAASVVPPSYESYQGYR